MTDLNKSIFDLEPSEPDNAIDAMYEASVIPMVKRVPSTQNVSDFSVLSENNSFILRWKNSPSKVSSHNVIIYSSSDSQSGCTFANATHLYTGKAETFVMQISDTLQSKNNFYKFWIISMYGKEELGITEFFTEDKWLNSGNPRRPVFDYKKSSSCELYIDHSVCKSGTSCLFNVVRLMFDVNGNSEIVNPFIQNNTSVAITIGSQTFSENYLYEMFESIYDSGSVLKSEYNKYGLLFAKRLNKDLSYDNQDTSCSFNDNATTFADVVVYCYISSNHSISVNKTSVFYKISDSYNRICLHIAGVMGLCSGEKVDSSLPKSNIFYSSGTGAYPIMMNNCNPYKCSKDYFGDYISAKIPACLTLCPFGAIKHKHTDLTSLPIDNDGQLSILSSLKMTEKPFAQ